METTYQIAAALEMSDAARSIRISGLRSRHPDASERELVARFIAEAHGVRPGRSG